MWEIVLREQVADVPYSLLWGFGLAVLYDLLRARRSVWPCGKVRLAVQDTLFGALAALLLYPLFLARCNGEIRGYMLLSAVLGFWLCRVTFSKIWLPFLRKFCGVLVRCGQITQKYFASFCTAAAKERARAVAWCRKVRKKFHFLQKKA